MHRALKALLLIALMLGYVFVQSGRTETFCLVTLDLCECESGRGCSPCEENSCGAEEIGEDHSDVPCCLDFSDAADWFVFENARYSLDALPTVPVVFTEFELPSFSSEPCLIIRSPDPPPLLGESFRFLECERILV